MPSKIKKRGENSYLLTVSGGYNADDTQKTFTKTVYCDNITEAENQYTLFAAEVLQGKVIAAGTNQMTLKEFYDYWKHHYAEKTHEKTTLAYNEALFIRIDSALGHLKINKILPKHILEFLDQLNAPDAGHGDKPLSPNTIKKHYTLLKTLYVFATRWEYTITNPMSKISPPKQAKPHKEILSEEEMAKFLTALSSDTIKHQLWVILAFTIGLRREEIFGLKWEDVNFDKKCLTINRAAVYVAGEGIVLKDTKTDSSYRKLSIPADAMILMSRWKEKIIAATKTKNKRHKIVSIEDPVGPQKWVFPQSNGSVGHPHAFNNFLRRFYKDNKLPSISPHLLRHMMGSYLLNSGVDLAAISKKLGHASKSFTANTYIHALQSAEQHSADTMQNILTNLKEKKEGQAT